MLPTGDTQIISNEPIPTASTPEKQSTPENMRSLRDYVQSSNPLPHEQILDIRQPVAQFIINTLLQVAAFAVAIAFGIFAIKSVQVGNLANSYANQSVEQSLTANQLTLLTFYFSTINGSQTSNLGSICSSVVEAAESMITGVASALFTNLPSPTTTSPSFATPSEPTSSGRPTTNIVGIGVGVSVGVLALLIGIFIYMLCLRTRSLHSSAGYPDAKDASDSKPLLQQNGFGKWFRETFMDTKVITRTR